MKILTLLLGGAVLLTGCGGGGSAVPSPVQSSSAPVPTSSVSKPSPQPSKPVVTESNPPGDIPDNQAFVAFQGAGFSVQVPEGWARTVVGTTTSFTDKLNRVEVTPSATAAAPAAVVAELGKSVPRFAMGKISEVSRTAGKVVLVTYQGDSAQDPVTGKVVRDAFERYLFSRGGKQVALTLIGPVNADNVDPWKTVSDSFRWA